MCDGTFPQSTLTLGTPMNGGLNGDGFSVEARSQRA